ncbi:MAG TPA: DedA family protein [Gammaproteobacteria bacterium]|nr:DedA family protein [Gammaproteobacteria bacterium]
MHPLHEFLRDYGYAALFCVVLVENFGIPAPGQTLLIAAAVLASQGKLNIVAVLADASLAAIIGACIGYWIGVKGGRRLVLRFGRYVRIGEPELQRMEAGFSRYSGWFVTFARFFEVLRQLNGVVAGIAGMPLKYFLPANVAGALLWTGVWGLGSWRLGRHIKDYENLTEEAGSIFVTLCIVVLLVLLILYLLHRWKSRRSPDT